MRLVRKASGGLEQETWTIIPEIMNDILFWLVVAILAFFALLGLLLFAFTSYFVWIKKADEINIKIPRDEREG